MALQRRQAVVLGYRDRKDGKTVGLLQQPGDVRWGLWTCPTSLRDVEAGINLLLGDDTQQAAGPDYDFPVPAGPDQSEQSPAATGPADDVAVTP